MSSPIGDGNGTREGCRKAFYLGVASAVVVVVILVLIAAAIRRALR